MYQQIKPLLFKFDSETVHDTIMRIASRTPGPLAKMAGSLKENQLNPVKSKNLQWKNNVGLAAGFDKNAIALNFFDKLGFGAIEVGTVTLKPQPGNPKPRIWRMPEENSLRNAMGFPSDGAEVVLPRVKKYKGKASLGVNIGKNKDTSLEEAPSEYRKLYDIFCSHCDYIVINVSSPNTQDLRDLQQKEALEKLLTAFADIEQRKPLFLKISPDENMTSVEQIIETAKEYKLSGIIATNTTSDHNFDKGGVSGEVLYPKSKKIWKKVLENTTEDFDLIAVGGFSNKEDFEEYYDLGGKFVQIYTSFVYQGTQALKNAIPQ